MNCGTQRSDKVEYNYGSDKAENSHNSCYNSGETLKDEEVSWQQLPPEMLSGVLNRGSGPLATVTTAQPSRPLPSNDHDFPLTQSNDVWGSIEKCLRRRFTEREFTLRQQVTYLRKKDDKTIGEHIRTFKSLCDSLAAIGNQSQTKKSLDQRRNGSQTMQMPPMQPSNGLLRTATTKISTILHRISDSVLIGDGSSLPILGIGDSSIKQKNKVLPLHDVLLVPHLKKNLISERQTGHPMITGRHKGDLYVLPNSPELYFSHRFKSGSADIWHQPFEQYVNRQFNKKIKVFHSDGGGEFINFKLSSHFLSTELYISGAPLFLWVKAFSTAVYLINRLPSSALNSETPYFALHGTHPNYTSLRVFGSKCFPYTWDTRQHKFDPKTILCIFVGYSDKHKGYKCFHPSSKKFFISRHVVIDELFFPYKNTQNQSMVPPTSHVISIFDSWLPQINSPHSVAIESQPLTPPCTSPLPTIPLLTSISNSVAGSSTNATSQPETAVLPSLQVELYEQSFNTLPNAIEPNQLGLQSPTHQKQPPQPQPAPSMITRSQRGIIKPNPKYALTSTTNSTSIPREPHNIRDALAHPDGKQQWMKNSKLCIQIKLGCLFHAPQTCMLLVQNGYSNQNSNPMVH
ncbi:Retrovirus-related Pol polyprotein from transposon RE1 [Vitis vinifera]|uniref:Retrovirus-related Pol polyprotein from transposon RE1 n=1 Tax=Vitis vinifera TaxID=29760 RepID=A0A438DNG3_VITVI|nr:Retrovirus-related Pol polyprotein from transposon RE1 [Vitis vinifera]